MLRKYFTSSSILAILLASSFLAVAQSTAIRGKVELKKGDVITPFKGATIDIYRTDIKAKFPPGKTNHTGEFAFEALPLGATMVLVVSGPGIKAELFPGVKAGREDINITVYEGDGQRLTEDAVRNALSSAPTQSGQSGQKEEARIEYEKQVSEITAKNKKTEEANNIIKAALDDGVKALNAGNYDLAVAKFEEGIQVDPEFPGSATVLYNNKAAALRKRGVDAYNQGVKEAANKATWLEKARNDFQGSMAASQSVLELIGKVADPAEAARYNRNKYTALLNVVETRQLLFATGIDMSQPDALAAALQNYLVIELDPALKTKTQVLVADAFLRSGNTSQAIPIYQKVLIVNPNHVEALGGLGLSLLNESELQDRIELSQEGLNLMQKFIELAPDGHPLKNDIKAAMGYLKDEKKLVPQNLKTPASTPGTGKKP
ncbi:MAG: tetratricopeptide repeat protein [Chitinophagaceae bacterium]